MSATRAEEGRDAPAHDAAKTAQEQVALSTIPNLQAIPRQLGGYELFTTTDRVPRDYRGVLYVFPTSHGFGGVDIVVAFRKHGAGYAVIRHWLVRVPIAGIGFGLVTARDIIGSGAIVRPSEIVRATANVAGPGGLRRDANEAKVMVAQVLFSDLTGEHRYNVRMILERDARGDWNVRQSRFALGWPSG